MDDEKKNTDDLREKVDENSSMKKSKESLMSTQTNSLRRGRSLVVNDTHSVYNPDRGRKASIINEQDANSSVRMHNSNSENITKVGLFNGGDCIVYQMKEDIWGVKNKDKNF